MWIDPRGLTLTFDNKRVIDDQRFGIVRPFIKDWNLLIGNVMPSEAGTYLCTINTPEVLFQSVQLIIKGGNGGNIYDDDEYDDGDDDDDDIDDNGVTMILVMILHLAPRIVI